MMCSAYFGKIKGVYLENWKDRNDNPYEIFETSMDLFGKGHELLYSGDDYFFDKIKLDWGSFAWKCSKEQIMSFLQEKKTTLPWLIESEEEILEKVSNYIQEHGDVQYGVVFVEEY